MAQIDRLRALQMGVARHRPVGVLLGDVRERRHQRGQQLDGALRALADIQRHVGRHLVVPRPSRVELAADRTDELRQAPLDRHVDVLVLRLERELAALELVRDATESVGQGLQLVLVEDPRPLERPGVGERAADVLRPEATVEAKRRVDAPEERVLGRVEAGHGYAQSFDPSPSESASQTRSTWPSFMPGKNGSAIDRSATDSATGNSPPLKPNRSR